MDEVQAVTDFAMRIAVDPSAEGFDEEAAVERKRSVQLIYLRKLIAEFEDRLAKNLGT